MGLAGWGQVVESQVNKFEQVQIMVTWPPPKQTRLTVTTENITFPQLRWRAVNSSSLNVYRHKVSKITRIGSSLNNEKGNCIVLFHGWN